MSERRPGARIAIQSRSSLASVEVAGTHDTGRTHALTSVATGDRLRPF